MEKIVPITELQAETDKFFDLIDGTGEAVVFTRAGRAAGVLIDYDYYVRLLVTIEEMNSPEAWQKLTRAKQEMAEGAWVSHDEVINRLGLERETDHGPDSVA